jgi:HEAT repeat protein/transcriptional regulator with XRE-family HTH domain
LIQPPSAQEGTFLLLANGLIEPAPPDTAPAPMSFLQELGELLRDRRAAMGHSQGGLARRVNVTDSWLSRIENGSRWPSEQLVLELEELLRAGQKLYVVWRAGEDAYDLAKDQNPELRKDEFLTTWGRTPPAMETQLGEGTDRLKQVARTIAADSSFTSSAAIDRYGGRPPGSRSVTASLRVHRYCERLAHRYTVWAGELFIEGTARRAAGPTLSWQSKASSTASELRVSRAIRAGRRVLLLGSSGSGKSTTLEKAALDEAHRFDGRAWVPIVVPLLLYTGDLRASIRAAVNAVEATHLGEEHVDLLLRRFACLIMLDGLNEVPGSRRDVVVSDIAQTITTYPQHRYIVTSRPEDALWATIPAGILDASIQLQPVSPGDALSYLCHHLGEQLGRFAFGELPSRSRELLASPLLLSIFKDQVASARRSMDDARILINEANLRVTRLIPRNRGDMYRLFADSLLARELQKGSTAAAHMPELKRRVLGTIALGMQRQRVLVWPRTRVLDAARHAIRQEGYDDAPAVVLQALQLNGLLAGENDIRFTHQSFQDFFAATTLARQGLTIAVDHSRDPWWTETIVFLAGILRGERLTRLLAGLADANVGLAVRCALEGNPPSDEARGRLRARLATMLGSSNWVHRKKAVELLGLMEDDSVVPLLSRMLHDESREVRWQVASSLRNFSSQEAAAALLDELRDPEEWAARARAAEALGRMGVRAAIPRLRPLLTSDMPRERADATYALVLMEATAEDPRVRALIEDSDAGVRDAAQLAIEVVMASDKIAYLRRQLTNPDPGIREKAAYLLTRLQAIEAIHDIASLMEDESRDVLIIAMQSLAELYAVEYFPAVIQQVHHPASFVRVIAAFCSGLFGFADAVPYLKAVLGDPDSEVRFAAVRALGELKAVDAIPSIVLLLTDPSARVRAQAAVALGVIGSPEAASALSAASQDPDVAVAAAAAAAIEQLGTSAPHLPEAEPLAEKSSNRMSSSP